MQSQETSVHFPGSEEVEDPIVKRANRWWMVNKMQLPAGIQLSSAAAREWLHGRRSNLRPWATFVTTSNFKGPQSLKRWSVRLAKNVEYFQSNYLFVAIGLIIYCLVTSPLLLLVLASMGGACYIASLRQKERALVIAGQTVPLPHQYVAILLVFTPIFFFAGAGAALFWVIIASFIVVMAHASFYSIEALLGDEEAPFEMQMDEV
ncbi:prenylated Rab acceptor protein 1 isoform X2 [Hyalella azteca]|uniref:PRA1 family protein n=1 Tax=Hyalella azteca TaxID=294128 RepID=A0A8B7NMT9_HYAAZ|nr:prenylated Rab acceptor protein 1 isoform X2 [Hyalella azteca]